MFNFEEIFVELFTNVLLLFSLGSIYILLPFSKKDNRTFLMVIVGVVSGLIGLMIMSTQFNIAEGILLDTRSILVSLVGAFFGAIPLLITVVIASILRIFQGGSGAYTGVLVIVVTGGTGYLFGKYRLNKFVKLTIKHILEFYLFGFVVHLLMLACFYTLPSGGANLVLGKIFLPVMILYPIATVPLAVILFKQKKNVEMSNQIDFISKHDFLTGIHNRFYFEKVIDEFNKEKFYPLSIIMGDVNGLKIINDSLGHDKGDKLLIAISSILESAISENHVLSRWGGDEFILILPNTSHIQANNIMIDITRKCDAELIEGKIKPSISLGLSTKVSDKYSMEEILKQAEDLMYRNKLSAGKSVRSNLISILENALLERSLETITHTHNMEQLSLMVSEDLDLEVKDIDELSLIARLHDIGKIGINDDILLKNGKLTDSEFELIKKHPEIGYRILSSIDELEHIAVGVLHHHERWDGTGYPQGLKGEEIPILSRIVSVADAYEVMTNGRIYKVPISQEDAIKELKRCSGTQFDPTIVKIFVRRILENKVEVQNSKYKS